MKMWCLWQIWGMYFTINQNQQGAFQRRLSEYQKNPDFDIFSMGKSTFQTCGKNPSVWWGVKPVETRDQLYPFWWLPKTLSNSKVLIAENVPTVHFHLWVDCLVNSCPILAHIFFSSKQGNNLFFFKITLQVSHGTNCLCWFSGLYFWTSWRRPKTNSNLLMSGFLLPE